jgi:hypothetical protein
MHAAYLKLVASCDTLNVRADQLDIQRALLLSRYNALHTEAAKLSKEEANYEQASQAYNTRAGVREKIPLLALPRRARSNGRLES